MPNRRTARMSAADTNVLIIDVQTKLLAAMPDAAGLVANIVFLQEAARLLDVPTIATEQYPAGLGPTHAEIVARLAGERPEKTDFSCRGCPGLFERLAASQRPNVLVCGMEAHVCVLQTVLDLIDHDRTVFVAVDAIQSRRAMDQQMAVTRMAKEGAVLTTVETAVFEWTAGSRHPQFKAISKLVRERTPSPSSAPIP